MPTNSSIHFTAYDNRDQTTITTCNLKCSRCQGSTKTGGLCKNKVCIGVPLCWLHTLQKYHVRAKPSGIAGAGMGLFAQYPTGTPPRKVAFAKNDLIVEYIGERTTKAALDAIYTDDDYTVPYAWSNSDFAIDSACKRGIGSVANQSSGALKPNAIIMFRSRDGVDTSLHSYTGNPARPNTFPNAWDKVYIVATRPIKYGDEILINYGDAYQLGGFVTHTTYKRSNKNLS